jgi:prevent-host-death family protein
MIDLNEIHSLTDFQRNVKTYIDRLKKTGRPVVLTVNGKAELVVQDAAAYQRLLDLIDRAEAVAGIKRGLESMHSGGGKPARTFLEEVRKKHKLPRKAR